MRDTTSASGTRTSATVYSRKNPFLAEITEHRILTKTETKDTRHFVVSLAGSGIAYTPGDSLGAFATNPPELVDKVLALLKMDPQTPAKHPDGRTDTLRQVLLKDFVLNRANRKVLAGIAERIHQGEQRNQLMEIVNNGDVLGDYIYSRDYVDVLNEFNEVEFESPESFLSLLSPIVPRLYSLASSQAAHPSEAHLCISVVRYETHGRAKTGLCSGYFADQTRLQEKMTPVYIQESRTFRLPEDNSKDIIMVGPGTGVAPFRAFLQQRILEGAKGRNWLIFGEQHQATDFLYGEEFIAMQNRGQLQRLDTAFSRDQAQKVYVQHRLLENGKEIWAWLSGGAYFYVCGDAKRMAKDVHQALIQVVQTEGGMSQEAAQEHVNVTLMRTEHRYLRDVY
jgi:sulfite reductase (NADPH) flavoprotein alpha-component